MEGRNAQVLELTHVQSLNSYVLSNHLKQLLPNRTQECSAPTWRDLETMNLSPKNFRDEVKTPKAVQATCSRVSPARATKVRDVTKGSGGKTAGAVVPVLGVQPGGRL
jgi:hypothetical protein